MSKQVFDGAILYKSLALIIHCHEDSNAKFTDKQKQLSSLFTEIGEGKEMTENEMKMHNDSKLSSTLLPHVVEQVAVYVVEHDAAHIVEHVDEEEP